MKNQQNNTKHSTPIREIPARGFYHLSLTSYLLPTILLLTGCMSAPKMPNVDFSTLTPPGPITSVIAAWEPAVSSGENSMRGFGGRVYFHDRDLRPAKVKGRVIVYVFDEDGRLPGDEKPNEGIVFDEKILNSKEIYKKSKLGHSYNLWIPLDSAGPEGKAKKVSLIVRYEPDKGAPVVSSQATVFLPGRHEAAMMAQNWQTRTNEGPIQQAGARAPLGRLPEQGEFPVDPRERLQMMEAVTIR
jgi:hypothetical protein